MPMLQRACLLVFVIGASGCFHNAKLATAREAVETFNAPVKCGPMGFRRVPFAARFGEYVRLTVTSPVTLTGTVMVHANGLAHPARVWTSATGELVVEARFENTDPDLPSALRATQPIDVTIAELTAPEGGSCEGAVFTLEHGRLVPPTTDALWIAELERRGGAELAARREARRRMTEEELARATESSQPEFSTVLAGWNEPETEPNTWSQPQLAQETVATSGSAIAVAQVNVGDQSTSAQSGAAQTNVGNQSTAAAQSSSVAIAQVNVGNQRNATAPSQNATVSVAQVNVGSQGTASAPSQNAVAQVGAQGNPVPAVQTPVAVAQVNVGANASQADFANADDFAEYDESIARRGVVVPPPLPSVAAVYPAGCTELACVIPATQCTTGCTPAPGTCTASSCSVSGQVIEVAVFPRGCVTNTCAMPITRCTGACTRAPGVFINGTYSCPAQAPVVNAAQTAAPANEEWNAPPSVTTKVAYELPPPPPRTQAVIVAPPPQEEVDVAVDIGAVLPWLFGAMVPAPVPVPVPIVAPAQRYVPVPAPVHGAAPVRARR